MYFLRRQVLAVARVRRIADFIEVALKFVERGLFEANTEVNVVILVGRVRRFDKAKAHVSHQLASQHVPTREAQNENS